MATIAETTSVPWNPEMVLKALEGAKGTMPMELVDYLRELIIYMDFTYSEIANSINNTNEEIEAVEARLTAGGL